MDKKKAVVPSSSSSSSSSSTLSSFDHIFGPRGTSSSPSPSSSSTTGLFKSIFPPPSSGMGRQVDLASQVGAGKYHSPNGGGRGERNNGNNYESEETQPCNLSSSIYYGGQENYSPKPPNTNSSFKKDGEDQSDSKSASRGNWWKGSLYY